MITCLRFSLKRVWKGIFIIVVAANNAFGFNPEYTDQLLKNESYSGTILLAKSNKVYWKEAYGEANKTKHELNTVDTVFPIASITKTLTSAVILKVLHEMDISVKTPVVKYLDQFPEEVTIESLLSHQSGFHLYTDFNHPDKARSTSMGKEEFYRILLKDREKPGQFNYNNGNYIALEHLSVMLTKQEYKCILDEKLIDFLQLKNTRILERTQSKGIAVGYTKAGDEAMSIDYSWLGGGAGISSTIQDIYQFTTALLTGQIVPPIILNEIFQNRGGNYGYGWTVGELDSKPIRYHEGGIDGFSTMLMVDPKEHHILVMFSNKEINIDSLSGKIFSRFLDEVP